MTESETPAAKAYKMTKAYIDEHPEPDRSELVTRGTKHSRSKMLAEIVDHLHWRFAGLRAEDIARGNESADGWYQPTPLEEIACPGGTHTAMEDLQDDVGVVATELLGLLWRLEDTGVIKRTETIVEAAGASSEQPIADCCEYTSEPWHDRLLALDSGDIWAAKEALMFIEAADMDHHDVEDFERFVAMHRWKDQRGVATFAAEIGSLARWIRGQKEVNA